MDKDAEMLNNLGNQITDLQIKYRVLPLDEQMAIHPALMRLLQEYSQYQSKLLMIGIITTDTDLDEIRAIKTAVNAAAKKMELFTAIAKLISFVTVRI